MAKSTQQSFSFRTWGGARKGAGRKLVGRPSVPHVPRPRHARAEPLIVTLRSRLRVLRAEEVFSGLRRAIRRASKGTFRVVHFSVQDDHVHLVCEAEDSVSLSRGISGLAIRLAKAANRVLRRTGSVWSTRYHARALRTPTSVRNALVYVLQNRKHHGPLERPTDPRSSAAWFDGWADASDAAPFDASRPPPLPPTAPPRTWLLTVGWRRLGRLSVHEAPR